MKELECFDAAFENISLDMEEVYQLMGYNGHKPDAQAAALAGEIASEIGCLVTPRCVYRTLAGKMESNQSLRIGTVQLNTGRVITHAMKGAMYYTFFLVTIGKEFDWYCEQLKKKDDVLRMFIADALGSVLAEATVAYFMNRLSSAAESEGLKISNNYSPGYCDWILEEQKKIFSFFPDEAIDIRLTESCLMLPVKSVSGIVAVGTDVKKQPYGCDICKMATCIKNKNLHDKEREIIKARTSY